MIISKRFEEFIFPDSFSRVDDLHVLNLYIGINEDSKKTLFLVSRNEPPQVASSQLISVQCRMRKDGRWGLSFILADNQYTELFLHFCKDIIDSSRILADEDKGADFVCSRYKKWQEMLAKTKNGILTPAEIKGLIGELCYLKETLIPAFGEIKAIDSWIGPENASQDFVFDNSWYEIKSTSSGAESISISSIEQLDTNASGELVVMYLDKTSTTDSRGITLNGIYRELMDSFYEDSAKLKLGTIMLTHGYYARPEYDEYVFRLNGSTHFSVNSSFPCLRKANLPSAVVGASYKLSLAAIKSYERE